MKREYFSRVLVAVAMFALVAVSALMSPAWAAPPDPFAFLQVSAVEIFKAVFAFVVVAMIVKAAVQLRLASRLYAVLRLARLKSRLEFSTYFTALARI